MSETGITFISTVRIEATRDKILPQLERNPHFVYTSIAAVFGEDGEFIRGTDVDGEEWALAGLGVTVTEIVDQRTLPADQRIPSCVDGVPVVVDLKGFDVAIGG